MSDLVQLPIKAIQKAEGAQHIMYPPGGAVYGNTSTDQRIREICIALWSWGLFKNTLSDTDRGIGIAGIGNSSANRGEGMLTFPGTVRIFICRSPVDMRKSYNGLSGCVQQVLKLDPLSGHLFVFFNRRRNQVKILLWDRTGYCIYGKRLEVGNFSYQDMDTDRALTMPELLLILEGIDLRTARYRKRYSLPEQTNGVHA